MTLFLVAIILWLLSLVGAALFIRHAIAEDQRYDSPPDLGDQSWWE